jgi:type IV pilus assembly protein PilQ
MNFAGRQRPSRHGASATRTCDIMTRPAHQVLRWLPLVLLSAAALAAAQPPAAPAPAEKRMSLDVKATDIGDAIRMVSKAYDLNIILDKDVTGKVTLHLSDVPIMEGLRSLTEPNGLEVTQEGSVYRIRRKTDAGKAVILYARDKLTVDVQNVDVLDFIKELSSKTAVSIVPDNKVTGRITGKLYQVDVDDGIRALLEGNGYIVVRRRNIYQVSVREDNSNPDRGARKPASGGVGGDFFVDYANGKLTIEVSNGDLEAVLKAITEQTDVQMVTYGSVKTEVNAKLYDKSLTEAFALLLGGTRFTFVEKNGIILIGDRNPATPSGQALTKSELVHLKCIKADAVPPIIPKNIPAENVKVIKEQNALLISGTSEDIVTVRQFLESIDIPTPQVRIDAVIVEFKESLDREFGTRFWRRPNSTSYQQLPYPATSFGDANSAVELGTSGASFKSFFGIDKGLLSRIPDDFFLVLKWLETQNKAKVLGQPSVMTLNGYKAVINVDETQYVKVAGGDANTQYYSVRVQPIKFGIQLAITPWISQGGQITAEVVPEVSNSDGKSVDGYPNVSTRAITTTVRLKDGQTLVLGGLIKNQESTFADKVPVLGDIPILGALFRHSGRTRSKTNLVIYITPHIVTLADTVNLEQELRNYDIQAMGTFEQRLAAKVRDQRTHRDSTDTAARAQPLSGAAAAAADSAHGTASADSVATAPSTKDDGKGRHRTRRHRAEAAAPPAR